MYVIIWLSKRNGVVFDIVSKEKIEVKDVLKVVTVKIVSLIIIIALAADGGYLTYKHFVGNIFGGVRHEKISGVEVVKEKLEAAAQLNTWSYLCTDMITIASENAETVIFGIFFNYVKVEWQ